MNRSLAGSLLAALALTGPAMADDLAYNSLELGLTIDSIGNPRRHHGPEGVGANIGGSWSFTSGVFGFASLDASSYGSAGFTDFTASLLQLGAGFHLPLGPRLDLVSDLSLQRLQQKDGQDHAILAPDEQSYTLHENGYGLKVALRGLIGRHIEWTTGLGYADFDGSGTSWMAGLRYHFTRRFSMGLNIRANDRSPATADGLLAFRWNP